MDSGTEIVYMGVGSAKAIAGVALASNSEKDAAIASKIDLIRILVKFTTYNFNVFSHKKPGEETHGFNRGRNRPVYILSIGYFEAISNRVTFL